VEESEMNGFFLICLLLFFFSLITRELYLELVRDCGMLEYDVN